MTKECDICGDQLSASDLVAVGDGHACPDCHDSLFVDDQTDSSSSGTSASHSRALEAFADAIAFFHEQIDRPIDDHQSGDHPDRPNTAREYFEGTRGWNTQTVRTKQLGWAPANDTALLDYLMSEGYDRNAILGIGLFTEDLRPLWQGRYVFPYFDVDGRPVYAISRSTGDAGGGAAGYDGHPSDFMSGKYAKPAHTKEHVAVDEPIYGLETITPGTPVLITEGIADAITAHECGYACISPVTTQFKHRDRERLVDLLEARDVERTYVVQDAERPSSNTDEDGQLTVEQFGPGEKGAVATADYLSDHGVDAHVAALPRSGLDKVDLDDYLRTWARDLSAVLASAKPAFDHPAHTPRDTAVRTAVESRGNRDTVETCGRSSALFDLDITDVTGLSKGYCGTNPLGHHGQSENYFVLTEGRDVAYDHKYKVSYNALTYLLCDAGIRSPSSPNGSLDDGELFAAWRTAKRQSLISEEDPIPHAALRHVAVEQGYCDPDDIEEGWRLPTDAYRAALDYVRNECDIDPGRSDSATDDRANTAVFPPAVRDLTRVTEGWDWAHAGSRDDQALSVEEARNRTTEAISTAYGTGDRVLVEALPTTGKSRGAIEAAVETCEPVTILTGRGREEQYDQFTAWCAEHDLTYKTLPSFTADCPTAAGEHGEKWRETVMSWYRRGVTPQAIHKWAEDVLGRPLPCQVTEDGETHECEYASKWRFDPDEHPGTGDSWDVLIGHYTHAYKQKVTTGRTVVFDEFPAGAYETTLADQLQQAVSCWLSTTDVVPFDDYTDLIENRTDDQLRADALTWFLGEQTDGDDRLDADEIHVFDNECAHAAAPLAVFALLAGEDLGNGFERAGLQETGVASVNRSAGSVSILRPPPLDYASGVVALDGTPTKEMWELALGERLNHRKVLVDGEWAEYIQEALNLNLVRTTDAIKPYNSSDHITMEQDAALFEAIADVHGDHPAVITSSTAEQTYDEEGITDLTSEIEHYGNILGSNEFKQIRLGAVVGSNHYGDGFIKKWGAYAGESVERNEGKGTGLSYGTFGDRILMHMREHDTLQAAMRFGRDGNGAVVYVHTNTLPKWVPLTEEGRVVTTWSDGMRSVLRALEDLGSATTVEIVEHPRVDIGRRQVLKHLETLRGRGVLTRDQDDADGRRVRWFGDSVHRVNGHGDVELPELDFDTLTTDEIAELARSSTYTWQFRNSGTASELSAVTGADTENKRGDIEPNGGDRTQADTD